MPSEPKTHQQIFALTAVLSDAVDGAARVMTDIAKFGLSFSELHVVNRPDGDASLRMCVMAPEETDMHNVSERLARHVSVVSLSLA